MTTEYHYTDLIRRGVYIRTGPPSPYDGDVVLGSELAALAAAEKQVQAALEKTMEEQLLDALLTGFPPDKQGIMSINNYNST